MYEEVVRFTHMEKKKGKKIQKGKENLPILYDLIKKRKYYPN